MASSMHMNFYEGWATRRHVEEALKGLKELLNMLKEVVSALLDQEEHDV